MLLHSKRLISLLFIFSPCALADSVTVSGGIDTINALSSPQQLLSTGTSGSDFAITSTGNTHTFNIPTASASNRGALSSADWSTFNGKQPALGYTPENISNKDNGTLSASTTTYPTSGGVKSYIDSAISVVNSAITSLTSVVALKLANVPADSSVFVELSGNDLTCAVNDKGRPCATYSKAKDLCLTISTPSNPCTIEFGYGSHNIGTNAKYYPDVFLKGQNVGSVDGVVGYQINTKINASGTFTRDVASWTLSPTSVIKFQNIQLIMTDDPYTMVADFSAINGARPEIGFYNAGVNGNISFIGPDSDTENYISVTLNAGYTTGAIDSSGGSVYLDGGYNIQGGLTLKNTNDGASGVFVKNAFTDILLEQSSSRNNDAQVYTLFGTITQTGDPAFSTIDKVTQYHTGASATLNFGSTAANSCSVLTITVNGAAVGDPVALGTPNASVGTNGTFFAWISALNTASVRFCNNTGSAIDPASGTFNVRIVK